MVPVLETPRLRLREFRQADFDIQAAILRDPEVVRHLGGALGREEVWRRMLGGVGLWPVLGFGYWAVERREDGSFIGQVGFGDFKREIQPSIDGLPEMGWILASQAQGQGYCSEAVAAGLAWADETLKAAEIVAIIAPENAASIRVAEKAGFERGEDTLYRGDPTLIFRRPARA